MATPKNKPAQGSIEVRAFDMPDLKPLFKKRKLTITRPRDAQGKIIEE